MHEELQSREVATQQMNRDYTQTDASEPGALQNDSHGNELNMSDNELNMSDSEAMIMGMLQGDLRKIAELVGLEAALIISREFSGTVLYVASTEALERLGRDERIKRGFQKGLSRRMLAKRFRMSERSVSRVINTPGPKLSLRLSRLLQGGA